MKVAEYVADFIAALSPRVYMVCGAGAMHLNDAMCHHPCLDVMAFHHEQAATFAAEADARVTNNIAVVHVTAGPGGTNTLTGLACAYVDSIPLLVIAGQVTSHTMVKHSGVRQLGMNELDVVGMAHPVTKYAITVTEPFMIRYHLERAVKAAMSGRRGPVFVEIPLDVQAAEIDPAHLTGFKEVDAGDVDKVGYLRRQAYEVIHELAGAKKPLLLIGNGVRLSGACAEVLKLVDRLDIPVISSWNASDIIASDHPSYVGRAGIFGDRASNGAAQECDVLLVLGSRLSVAQTGHHAHLFAPQAKKIIVDIDQAEMFKPTVKAHLAITADVREFLVQMLAQPLPRGSVWGSRRPEARVPATGGVDAYQFIEQLSVHLDDDAIIVTDVGFSFIPTMQTLRLRGTQRLFHSSGVSPMGWAIPAAIGACRAAPGRQVVCLTGDGGAMMNLQELQTIAQHKLPIAIFVYANDGYATMRIAQNTHFGRESVAGAESGVTCVDFLRLGLAFRAHALRPFVDDVTADLPHYLNGGKAHPLVVELTMTPDQLITPRVQSRTDKDGKFIPGPISDMWPYAEVKEAAC